MFATDIRPVELKAALAQALATEHAGVLVSARMHWQVPVDTALEEAALAATEMMDGPLQLAATQWRVRRSALGSLLHVMGTDDRGRTLVITVNHGPTSDVQLTLFGNHGVIRLDRAEMSFTGPTTALDSATLKSLSAALSAI